MFVITMEPGTQASDADNADDSTAAAAAASKIDVQTVATLRNLHGWGASLGFLGVL